MSKIVRKKAGYTLVEVMMCIFGLAWLAGIIGIVYVVAHFIAKFW